MHDRYALVMKYTYRYQCCLCTDPLCQYRYHCTHEAGVHSVGLTWFSKLRKFLQSGEWNELEPTPYSYQIHCMSTSAVLTVIFILQQCQKFW